MKNYRELLIRELKKSALSERTHECYIRETTKLFTHYSKKDSDKSIVVTLSARHRQGSSFFLLFFTNSCTPRVNNSSPSGILYYSI